MAKPSNKVIRTIIGVFVFLLLYFGYGIYTVNKIIKVNELNTESNIYPVTSNVIVSKDESKLVFVRDTGDHRPSEYFGEGVDVYNQLVIKDIKDNSERVLVNSGPMDSSNIKNLPESYPIDKFIYIAGPKFSPSDDIVYFQVAAWSTSSAIFAIDLKTSVITYITDGDLLEVITNGENTGDLIVNQRHIVSDQGGVEYCNYIINVKTGERLKDLNHCL